MNAPLPRWADMSDLDKGAAILHLWKRDWEGADYAESDYPCRYLEHPALIALDVPEACRHAVSLEPQAQVLSPDEWDRLYHLALNAERSRS